MMLEPKAGEILMGGRHVMMGYLGNPKQTAETIEDTKEGWLRTGDVGILDAEGYLSITGRIKEILITAGGENVPPVPIEDAIKLELPCISNALVVGDQQKFLSCLLCLKTEVDPRTSCRMRRLTTGTQKWLSEAAGIEGARTVVELLEGQDYPKFAKGIQAGIDSVNRKAVSNAHKIQKWVLLKKDFCVPCGELGPTLKIKRHVIANNYKQTIAALYE